MRLRKLAALALRSLAAPPTRRPIPAVPGRTPRAEEPTAADQGTRTAAPDAAPPVGYLVHRRDGSKGRRGVGYDYLLAGNGVFVEAESPGLCARFLAAPARLRGLPDSVPWLRLPHGEIPRGLLIQGIRWFQETPEQERFFIIRHQDGEYRLETPVQEGRAASLQYEPQEGHVAEFHSHGAMPAFFSATDDRDEQGFRIYGVVGQLHRESPRIALRVGIYGHFQEIKLEDVFE